MLRRKIASNLNKYLSAQTAAIWRLHWNNLMWHFFFKYLLSFRWVFDCNRVKLLSSFNILWNKLTTFNIDVRCIDFLTQQNNTITVPNHKCDNNANEFFFVVRKRPHTHFRNWWNVIESKSNKQKKFQTTFITNVEISQTALKC